MAVITWTPGADGLEVASIGVAKAKIYPLHPGAASTVWVAEVTGDLEPTEHPTRYTAKLAATRRLWALKADEL